MIDATSKYAYVRNSQHTSAYVSSGVIDANRRYACVNRREKQSACVSISQHSTRRYAYSRNSQHASAYVSIRQHARNGGGLSAREHTSSGVIDATSTAFCVSICTFVPAKQANLST